MSQLPWWQQLLCITLGIAAYNQVVLPIMRVIFMLILRKLRESKR